MAMRRLVLSYVSCFLSIVSTSAQADWHGPHEIIRGNWGNGEGEYGIEHGDTSDMVPFISSIMPDNTIAITDIPGRKNIFITTDGKLIKEVRWKVHREGNKTTFKSDVTVINNIRVYYKDGSVLAGSGNKYYLYSLRGKLLKTYTTPPPELGITKNRRINIYEKGYTYEVTVTYPDRQWILLTEPLYECSRFQRGACGDLYCINDNYRPANIARIGKNLAGRPVRVRSLDRLEMPENVYKPHGQYPPDIDPPHEVLTGYGPPVLAPNGDVYTWKRTEKTYSIIKWVWTDGPDAPVVQKAVSDREGITLTWKRPKEKSKSIIGYEIERSENVCGPYEPIGKVKRGVLSFADKEEGLEKTDLFCKIYAEMSRDMANVPNLCSNAEKEQAGTTYYYRARALYKNGQSGYSNKAIGGR